MASPLEPSYNALCTAVARGALSTQPVTDALIDCVGSSLEILAGTPRTTLISRVAGKEYFAFVNAEADRVSRGVNEALFLADIDEVLATVTHVINGQIPADPIELHQALYTAAISYPAATDVLKKDDKKTPGTFFEIFIGHLVATAYGVVPQTTVTVPSLDQNVMVTTDFVFDLGPDRSRIHLPVKLSTRERSVQVWAHQRILDGMHGVNRFRGLLVVLAETNKMKGGAIIENCQPNQWIAYQMYIAQLHRAYYFDPPIKYMALREHYPYVQVRHFADFFYEYHAVANPNLGSAGSVEAAGPPPSFVGLPEDEEV